MTEARSEDAWIAPLLARGGFGACVAIEALRGGANNRVYRIVTQQGLFLLKHYDPHDPAAARRAAADFAFTQFAWEGGCRAVPQPLLHDAAACANLFRFIDGGIPPAGAPTAADVHQALDFVRTLQAWRNTPRAAALGDAQEACFRTAEHYATVERRSRRLLAIEPADAVDSDARRFVGEELMPLWAAMRDHVERQLDRIGATDTPLPAAQRCLSPSDFGFHNALRGPDGRWVFFDFEYAGWDDPAKLVCDFFCQVQVPVAPAFFDAFAAGVVDAMALEAAHLERMRALLPVHRLKWICIVLNEFLTDKRQRRGFALPGADLDERKREQLAKARDLLAAVRAAMEATN